MKKRPTPPPSKPSSPAAPSPATRPRRADAPDEGQTRIPVDADGDDLQLPHERDESTSTDGARPRDVMRRAKADLDAGLVDTDMRATPGLDAQRREELLRKQRR